MDGDNKDEKQYMEDQMPMTHSFGNNLKDVLKSKKLLSVRQTGEKLVHMTFSRQKKVEGNASGKNEKVIVYFFSLTFF